METVPHGFNELQRSLNLSSDQEDSPEPSRSIPFKPRMAHAVDERAQKRHHQNHLQGFF
jgi:hypothetical protein